MAEWEPSAEWLDEVADTGQWLDVARWGTGSEGQFGPFSPEEVASATEWLCKAFPPSLARRLFRQGNTNLYYRMRDPSPFRIHPLAWVGLDLAIFQPGAELLRQLQTDDGFPGAAFEASVGAGLDQVGIRHEYEPFKAVGGANPDFHIEINGYSLLLEVKFATLSPWTKKAQRIARRLTLNCGMGMLADNHRHQIFFTEKLRSMLHDRAGLNDLEGQYVEVAKEVAQFLSENAPGPTQKTIRGLLEVGVFPRESGQGLSGQFESAVPDAVSEVRRLLPNAIARGANQLREGMPGVVLVDFVEGTQPDVVLDELHCWIDDEEGGKLYPNLLGVLGVFREWLPGAPMPLLRVIPAWSWDAPPVVADWRFWARFEVGLNWQRILKWVWSEKRQG